jgi:hypothetical protein
LRGLRRDVDPRDALQIAAVLAVRTPLARGSMQPRERQRSRPLIAQISSTAKHGRRRRAIPATPWNWSHITQLRSV